MSRCYCFEKFNASLPKGIKVTCFKDECRNYREGRKLEREELFNKIRNLSKRLEQLSGIIQNDGDCTVDELMAWSIETKSVISDLEETRREVYEYFL